MVARVLNVEPLLRDEATKSAIRSKMHEAAYMHFVTHAYFDPSDPLASGILLAHGDVLTAREFLTQQLKTLLLVISGCETGLQSIGVGDELAGFARALLYAGVPTLALSQWAVNDLSSAMLMARFYNYLFKDEKEPRALADALRAAMLNTRKDLPHTYYWAPFILYGDWR